MTEGGLQQTLASSAEEVLEKMFFFAPPDAPACGSRNFEPEIAARVGFAGDPPGELRIQVTREAARSIAADFLAIESQEVEEDQVGDVIRELANMICGSVLSRMESSAVFHLNSPDLVPSAGTIASPAGEAAVHSLTLYGGALTVAMTMDRPPCARNEK